MQLKMARLDNTYSHMYMISLNLHVVCETSKCIKHKIGDM